MTSSDTLGSDPGAEGATEWQNASLAWASSSGERSAWIGPLRVLRPLGSGAMGDVYLCQDPQRDGELCAAKVLKDVVACDEEGLARFQREVEAQARLSAHPGIVRVYHAGRTHEGRPYMAMEVIEGESLAGLLRRGLAPEHAVQVIAQAAAALAFAHERGLVHRDVKPENVMVDARGRAKVADFGLAKLLEGQGDGLTRTGEILGTPAFMAPEQHVGAETEPATDQFAFCVSLYQALYGERPFAGDSARALAKATLRGDIRAAPAGSKVPAHLRRVLLRGLRARARERYPSMAALLRDLAHDPGTTRRRLAMWGVGVAAVIGATSAAYFSGARQQSAACTGADAESTTVWSDRRRTRIAEAFGATQVDYASDAWARSARAIDEWVADWRAQQIDACEATRVRGTSSEAILDKRTVCLRRSLTRLDGLLEVFEAADPSVVEKSVKLAYGLPELEACADLEALAALVPPPDSPELRARVAEADLVFERAQALYSAGRFAEVLERLEPWLPRAEQLGYLPLLARLRHLVGSAHDALGNGAKGDALVRQAFLDGLASGDVLITVMSAASLGQALGGEDGRVDEGLQYLDIADALIRRSPKAVTPTADVAVASARAVVTMTKGDYEEAERLFRRVVELQAARDPDAPNAVISLQNLGIFYAEQRRWPLAEDYLGRARALAVRVYGEEHPEMQALYLASGQVELLQQRYSEAKRWLMQALRIQRRIFESDHPAIAGTLQSLAIIARNLGDLEESEQLHREALRIRRAKLGEDHLAVAESLRNLATALSSQDRDEEALELAQEALAIAQKRLTDGNPGLSDAHEVVAWMLVNLERPEEALVHASEAIDALGAVEGTRSVRALGGMWVLGVAQRKLGRNAEALMTHERALELAEEHGTTHEIARSRYHLARSLAATEDGIERARALVEQLQREVADDPAGSELRADLADLAAELGA